MFKWQYLIICMNTARISKCQAVSNALKRKKTSEQGQSMVHVYEWTAYDVPGKIPKRLVRHLKELGWICGCANWRFQNLCATGWSSQDLFQGLVVGSCWPGRTVKCRPVKSTLCLYPACLWETVWLQLVEKGAHHGSERVRPSTFSTVRAQNKRW